MSGIIAVYGLVVSVLIAGGRECPLSLRIPGLLRFLFLAECIEWPLFSVLVKPTDYSLYAGFIHLGAGLACGFTGLAAGYAIGFVGDSVRSRHCTYCALLTEPSSACAHMFSSPRCS